MAMAICPDARPRKSTSPGTNGVSVVREIDRVPRTRPRFTSGIRQMAFMPSAATISYASAASASRSPVQNTKGFNVFMTCLLAGLNVTVTSSFTAPWPCGKSTAITRDFPDAASGSDTTTASACMTRVCSLQSRAEPPADRGST